jgi:hypothetical protein
MHAEISINTGNVEDSCIQILNDSFKKKGMLSRFEKEGNSKYSEKMFFIFLVVKEQPRFNDQSFENDDVELNIDLYDCFQNHGLLQQQVVGYIAGFVAKKVVNCVYENLIKILMTSYKFSDAS